MREQGQQKTFMVQQGDKQIPLTLEIATQIIDSLQKQLVEKDKIINQLRLKNSYSSITVSSFLIFLSNNL